MFEIKYKVQYYSLFYKVWETDSEHMFRWTAVRKFKKVAFSGDHITRWRIICDDSLYMTLNKHQFRKGSAVRKSKKK